MTPPINDILPELKTALAAHQTVILQAPPGAGKTTQVPLALLDADWLQGKKILMLEPRRLAATNAARYMSKLRSESVGGTIGYTIRYQRQVSKQTRIEVVTEGILTRRLQSNPELEGVGLIIFDEFHERNLNSDLALALCYDAQQGLRDDLKILIMSATLDAEPLAKLLNAPLLSSAGRSYPVTIHYAAQETDNLIAGTTAAVHRALAETEGDILVFLPGAGEINRCRQLLMGLNEVDICPLYGALPYPDQEKAIKSGIRRKVVLATNIAETSLTIAGIRVVIDSGYARQPRFDPASGLTRLELVRISQASAAQRTGRAGRLSAGVCYRLWSQGAHGSLLPFTPPEIRNADLAPLVLELANWGCPNPLELTWLDPPPTGGLQAGRRLLQLLNALSSSHQLTTIGRALAKLPTHPRLGRLLLAAEKLDCLSLGCDLVALLSEPSPDRYQQLQTQLETLWRCRKQGQLEAYRNIERAAAYWRKRYQLKPVNGLPNNNRRLLGKLLASAFPDRIGRLRHGENDRYLFASGRGGQLQKNSPLHKQKFLVATELTGKRGQEGQIIQATGLELTDILTLYPDCPWTKEVFWDDQTGRIVARNVQQFGKLNLAEKPASSSMEESSTVLLEMLRTKGLEVLNWTPEVETFRARVALIRGAYPDENWLELSNAKLLINIEDWLLPFIADVKNTNGLQKINLLAALQSLFTWQQLRKIDKLTPERLKVASGSSIKIQYYLNSQPILAVKLQEMFGESDTPHIGAGRIPVQLHLLSPAGRPLQVTQDLRTFWDDVYPEVKKEMRGRYPKHPWPDDPWNALPTRYTKQRRGR
ncbi:ATP-dependent helicase HrpB [Desulfuromusa kysingii]|uniref:ATP-dependent helicase HrpB n=1 Tax=Desulfuromusa kysingii TaxID=37625 RepID=A0A1H4BMG0_9BACT|nr:ATP-dependent helicase HrpB [Desulfuromusa kysingii]SEA49321.1 ATP-dependent helicase HrpB [Desulfuromusa kysingii]